MLSKHEYFCYIRLAVPIEDALPFVILHSINITESKCHIYKYKTLLGRDNKLYELSISPTDRWQIKWQKNKKKSIAAQQGQMV